MTVTSWCAACITKLTSWNSCSAVHVLFCFMLCTLTCSVVRISDWLFVRLLIFLHLCASSALTLLVGRHEGHPACKQTEWWGAGIIICLELGADLHMAQLMPLPLTVSCFSKIPIGFTFLVPAHLGSPGKRAVKRVCVCCMSFIGMVLLYCV